MNEKDFLREKYKALRKSLDINKKNNMDRAIYNNIIDNSLYKRCRQVLIFVSTAQEIDTANIIKKAIKDNKTTAVPRTYKETRELKFYKITSLSNLQKRSLNIYEPHEKSENLAEDYSDTIIIVPAFAIDKKGFRLGYGGGYYDNFLKDINTLRTPAIGICYDSFLVDTLPRESFDIPCSHIITEKNYYKIH